jgi:hypothetical protein
MIPITTTAALAAARQADLRRDAEHCALARRLKASNRAGQRHQLRVPGVPRWRRLAARVG